MQSHAPQRAGIVGVASLLLLTIFSSLPVSAQSSVVYSGEQADVIDLNSSTEDQLKTVKRNSDAAAEKIIKDRPYDWKDEVVQKIILPRATYEHIENGIVPKQK